MIARLLRILDREHPFWAHASQACVLCRQASSYILCPVCRQDLPRFSLHRCQGNLMHQPAVALQMTDVPFKQVLAAAPYVWPYNQWIPQLKFQQRLHCARLLAEQFVRVCQPYVLDPPQCIWPTPLHRNRLMVRQFNQAYQVAHSIGRALNIRVNEGPVARIRHTPAQTGLSGAERRRNVKTAFCADNIPDLDHVVLFDDVMTTGSTLAAQYNLLKENRPHMRIDIWSLCISVPQRRLAACVDKPGHENGIAQ